MVKVLVSLSDKTKTQNYCNCLSNDKALKVFVTYTGVSTLNTYLEIKPDIFILGSSFDDLNGIEIINRLSLSLEEKKKCNTILIVNSLDECSSLNTFSKIYTIVKNLSEDELLNLVNQLCHENISLQLSSVELQKYLVDLGFHIRSNGTDYMESAIQLCFYYSEFLTSLDAILEYVAMEYSTTPYSVRDALRASLKPLNSYIRSYSCDSNSLCSIFNKNVDVTPKTFIEKSVVYLRSELQKKKK